MFFHQTPAFFLETFQSADGPCCPLAPDKTFATPKIARGRAFRAHGRGLAQALRLPLPDIGLRHAAFELRVGRQPENRLFRTDAQLRRILRDRKSVV